MPLIRNDFKNITKEFEAELNQFNKEFDEIIQSDVHLLKYILKYIFKNKGKQLRPLFIILSSGLCGKINDKTYKVAALIEILHTATLIHDDIIDEAELRRGVFSVNALWKNKAAVLVGDYLLVRGLLVALDNEYFDLLNIVAQAIRMMSEGELLQIQKARTWNIDEDIYYEIIKKKTASLFAVSFQVGAYSADADEDTQKQLFETGMKIGMAFQIKDDLLDFNGKKIGKAKLNDLKEQKLTLPIIYAFNNSTFFEKKKYLSYIKSMKKEKLTQTINWIENKGGFDYAENKMKEYAKLALQELENFSDNKYKKGIIETINFLVNRSY